MSSSLEKARVSPRAQLSGHIEVEPPVTINDSIVVGPVHIGRCSYVGNFCHVAQGTTIGRYVSMANCCTIGAQDHPLDWLSTHPFQYHGFQVPGVSTVAWAKDHSPTTIGNDVWIGANVVVCAGVTVGDGAVLGAGTIVTHNVPPYAVVAGVPGRVLKYRFDPSTIAVLVELRWWDLPPADLRDLPFDDVHACIARLRERRLVAAPPGQLD